MLVVDISNGFARPVFAGRRVAVGLGSACKYPDQFRYHVRAVFPRSKLRLLDVVFQAFQMYLALVRLQVGIFPHNRSGRLDVSKSERSHSS